MKLLSLSVFVVFLFVANSLLAQQQGFFLDDLQEKSPVMPTYVEVPKPTAPATASVLINFDQVITPVSKYLFGNNVNPYMTQIVTEPQLLQYITDLSPNILRFPGGNISSVYLWNAENNQPPLDAPQKLLDGNGAEINAGYWYGKNNEGWTISVDNYYQTLEQTNSTGIITVNYGYARYSTASDPVAAAAHLAADWVRYDNGRTKFWEIGNESNGSWQAGYRINTANNKDGQPEFITGSIYGKHFKVFADSMRKAATEVGATIYIGAQLLAEEPASWWNDTDRNWNSGVFAQAGNDPDYYIIHSYYTPYNANSNASSILATAQSVTSSMMTYVTNSVSAAGLNQKPLALTEWNIFAVGSKQMISYINGMHAAIVLGELIKNKYAMASRWDLANAYDNGNDHGTFSQGNEPNVPKWNPRPAFFYMYYFQKFFGDHMVSSMVAGTSDILSYASSFSTGESSVVIVNKGSANHVVDLNIVNRGVGEKYYYYTLTGGTDNGEFSLKVNVNDAAPTYSAGGPNNYATIPAKAVPIPGGIKISAPAHSVVYVLVDKGSSIVTGTLDPLDEELKLYPNPSSGTFQIDLPRSEDCDIQIADVSGRIVYKKRLTSKSGIVEPFLGRGLYLVSIKQGTKTMHSKIVIE